MIAQDKILGDFQKSISPKFGAGGLKRTVLPNVALKLEIPDQ